MLRSVLDVGATHIAKAVLEEEVEYQSFEGQPDAENYRYQLIEIEGVRAPICSDRFEAA